MCEGVQELRQGKRVPRDRPLLAGLVGLATATVAAGGAFAEYGALTLVTPPAPAGVVAEARMTVAAPAERVARLVADPAALVELLPATEVSVVAETGAARVVSVVRREPWPVGAVRWTEKVEGRS